MSDDQIKAAISQSTPTGTKNRNSWAMTVYKKWEHERIVMDDEYGAPLLPTADELLEASNESLDYWLSKFVMEVRKDGKVMYPRNSLVSIIAGINASIKLNGRKLNVFKDSEFTHFQTVLDVACKNASSQAFEPRKQAEVISQSEEKLMWEKGALGDSNPTLLVNTVLYLNGLHFAMRSGKEHRDLGINQIQITKPNSECNYYCLEYTEKISKTNNGGFKQRRIEPKIVKHVDYNSIDNPSQSHALLIEKYLELRQKCNNTAFYLSPNPGYLSSGQWFKNMAMGHNQLSKVVKTICIVAGISGYKTNHSLRATCATRLFEKGVDEQLIMNRTGHRSEKGVRNYKRVNDIHHHNTSVIIDNKSLQQMQSSNFSKNESSGATFNFHFNQGCIVNITNNVPASTAPSGSS